MPILAVSLDYDDASLPAAGKTANLYTYPVATAQSGALAHWVFDRGGEDSLIDLVGDYALTPQADTYGFGTNSLTVAGAAGNALLTPFDDGDDLLLWFVARRPALAASAVFAGTLGPTDGGGFGLHQVASTAAVYARQRVVGTGQPAKATNAAYGSVGVGDWFFAAGYTGTRAAVPDEGVELFRGPSTLAQTAISPATADIISGRKIGLGNGYYTGQGTTDLEFAEFGILAATELTGGNGAALYADAQARMAARGITI